MLNSCYIGDCVDGLQKMAAAGIRVQTCVTSPPYWGLRDYGHPEAYGLEPSIDDWVDRMVAVFRAVRDVLSDDGTVWLNLGDGYNTATSGSGRQGSKGERYGRRHTQPNLKSGLSAGRLKPKDLIGQPWRVAFALQDDGWYLRQDIIWSKPAPMPESVRDRCTKSHEYLFLLSKQPRYYFDAEAISEEASSNTHARTARHKEGQGSDRAHGGTKRMTPKTPGIHSKAVGGWAHGDRGHSAIEHARGPKDAGRANQGLRDSTKFGRGRGWRDPASPKYRDAGEEHRTKQGLAASEREWKPRVKQNGSFSAAVTQPVARRNRRSVWTIAAEPYSEAHFATFPRKLIEPCILAGSRPGDIVLDPFMGSGTTAQVAEHLGRQWIGCEINPDYLELQRHRLQQRSLGLDKARGR